MSARPALGRLKWISLQQVGAVMTIAQTLGLGLAFASGNGADIGLEVGLFGISPSLPARVMLVAPAAGGGFFVAPVDGTELGRFHLPFGCGQRVAVSLPALVVKPTPVAGDVRTEAALDGTHFWPPFGGAWGL
jgi:hypothetical protein